MNNNKPSLDPLSNGKKIQGYWGHEPIWRELTPRERLDQFAKNQKLLETEKKGINFIADCMDAKARNII